MRLRTLSSFWKAVRRRNALERDLDDEMRFHLDARAADLVRSGRTPAEAARRARLEFGNPEAWQERCRDVRHLHLADDALADVRFALRSIARHRLLSSVVILTLATGVGISSGIFTLFEAAAMRPHVPDPATFAQIYVASTTDRARPGRPGDATFDEYAEFSRARTLSALAAHRRILLPMAASGNQPLPVHLATCNFFDVLGSGPPVRGRLLRPDDCTSAAPVVVIDEDLWRNRLDGNPSVVGSTLVLNGAALTIVGVAPRAASQFDDARAWLPYTIRTYVSAGDPSTAPWLAVWGRLAPGATRDDVESELSVLAANDDSLHPGRTTSVMVRNGSIVQDPRKPLVVPFIALIMGALTCLVLIACANISTLLLSQADARQHEVAIRLSLGAGRGRLLRMLLTETFVLAAIAGGGAIWLAREAPIVFFDWFGAGQPAYSLAPDWRVFLFLAATTGIAALAAGLAPALESLRIDVLDALKGHRTVAGVPGSRTLRNGLIGVQVALSFVLLTGAGLFAMTHYRIATGAPGFEARHLLVIRGDAAPEALRAALERLAGTRIVAFARTAPVLFPSAADISGDAGPIGRADLNEVTPEYFPAVGLRLLRGRVLTAADPPCTPSGCHVVVSEAFARRLAPGTEAVGRVIRRGDVPLEIVGVVADLSAQQIGTPDPPIVYAPWTRTGPPYQVVARFDGPPDAFVRSATTTLRDSLPRTMVDVRTARWYIDAWLEELGPGEALIIALGTAAVLLAVIGVFGVVSLSVTRRRSELGIRLALGARASHIYAAVVGSGLGPVLCGLVVGVVLALGTATIFSGVFASMHLAVSARDPSTYSLVGLLLAVVVGTALAVPARRASRLDPLQAIRYE